jgi:8-oxo-dGTP pyrophosphatase MutT (NUDIX family)
MPVTIYTEDNSQEVEDLRKFAEKYTIVQAAGGVVTNDEAKVLLIYRRGKWDLPKGKVEENEPLELCANREVIEETGLNELLLRKPLAVTYHTYIEKGKDILKETHWYLFDAPGKQKLDPQLEEDIQKAEWVEVEKVNDYKRNTYLLIRDVLQAAGF